METHKEKCKCEKWDNDIIDTSHCEIHRGTPQNTKEEWKAQFRMFVPEDDGSAMDWFENVLTHQKQTIMDMCDDVWEEHNLTHCPPLSDLKERISKEI